MDSRLAKKFARALLLSAAALLSGVGSPVLAAHPSQAAQFPQAAYASPAARASRAVLVGTVSRVVDGDTLVVQLSTGPIKVRLYGIDAPEHNQPGGFESAATLRSLVAGKQVSLEPVNQDRYSRLVAKVFQGRLNVNAEMVARGEAWVYRRYLAKADRPWCGLETDARGRRLGLWKRREVIPPWAFRHHTRDFSIPPCP